MRAIALIILSLMAVAPASAQYVDLRPRGAVPRLDGCNQMFGYPDCHPDRMYYGRSVAIPTRRGPYANMPVYPPEMPDYNNR
jgi:hypothetical protein